MHLHRVLASLLAAWWLCLAPTHLLPLALMSTPHLLTPAQTWPPTCLGRSSSYKGFWLQEDEVERGQRENDLWESQVGSTQDLFQVTGLGGTDDSVLEQLSSQHKLGSASLSASVSVLVSLHLPLLSTDSGLRNSLSSLYAGICMKLMQRRTQKRVYCVFTTYQITHAFL